MTVNSMFGMPAEDIRKEIAGMIEPDPKMYAMSILSDCQELLAMPGPGEALAGGSGGRADDIRKRINIAKYVISELLNERK